MKNVWKNRRKRYGIRYNRIEDRPREYERFVKRDTDVVSSGRSHVDIMDFFGTNDFVDK